MIMMYLSSLHFLRFLRTRTARGIRRGRVAILPRSCALPAGKVGAKVVYIDARIDIHVLLHLLGGSLRGG